MYTFPELIKEIRKASDLTQDDFARAISVSKPLISMIESGQKEVSKKFILKLANKLKVHPSSITPFLFTENTLNKGASASIEKKFIEMGEMLQVYLIEKKAKELRKFV